MNAGAGPSETAAIVAAIAWVVSIQQQEEVLRRTIPPAEAWSPQLRAWDWGEGWRGLVEPESPSEPVV